MPKFNEFLFGSKDKKMSLLPKNLQMALEQFLNQGIEGNPLYGAGQSYLQNILGGSPEAFQNFERPYMENFEQNIAPSIAERFAGAGTGAGALGSSGLQNSLAQAGRGLQTDLAHLRSGLQQQALPQALGYAQQPYSNKLGGLQVGAASSGYRPGSSGLFGGLAGGVGQGLGIGAGLSGFGGGGLPSWLSGLFGGGQGGIGPGSGAGAQVANMNLPRAGAY